jgi:hypothetical protein
MFIRILYQIIPASTDFPYHTFTYNLSYNSLWNGEITFTLLSFFPHIAEHVSANNMQLELCLQMILFYIFVI